MKEETMNRIAEAVKIEIGKECEVQFLKVEKNNRLMLEAVVIREPGAAISPIIYIDQFLDQIADGNISIQKAAYRIADIYRKNDTEKRRFSDVIKNLTKETILEKVIYQVVGTERNNKRLLKLPHKDVLDLSAIYRMKVDDDSVGTDSVVITYEFCNKYGIKSDELDIAAYRNTEKEGFITMSIKDFVAGTSEETTEKDLVMYIITSTSCISGAAVILYETYFEALARNLGCDLYVLPSSILEVIAIRADEFDMKVEEIRKLVMKVNSYIPEDEILSDNVYKYSLKTGKLTIA